MNINILLSNIFYQALIDAGAPENCKPQVRQSVETKFGDYQVNGIMAIAKQLGIPSRQLATKVVSMLKLEDMVHKIEVVGPGFINIFLKPQWLVKQTTNTLLSSRLGISPVSPKTIVVDYSAPNIAKEMHVGHLRSTIIGDATVRTLEFLGHNVIRANHLGDWGTQFGMLIAYLEMVQADSEENIKLSNLENFYREAKKHYDTDSIFAARSRSYVVKLQNGDEYCRKMWQRLVNLTIQKNQIDYKRLNITLRTDDIMGESLYHGLLPNIVADLKAKGLAVESKGAIVVFLPEFKNKDGDSMGVIIQKKDGAYLYTTTDIACIKYRYEKLKADIIIYYIDSRQHQHLMQVWTIVRKAGYIPESVLLEHHMFGMMLNKDGKPFKTRTGGIIKITDLLDEAIKRAKLFILSKNPGIGIKEKEEQLEKLAEVIGMGALKYADLSKNRTTNYIFSWDNMLNLQGNTAPYIQYTYSRIISILKRINQHETTLSGEVQLLEDTELVRQLVVSILQYEETLNVVASAGTPHVLCAYLYKIARLFSSFYEKNTILYTENQNLRHSRLQLAFLTSRILKHGLNLLGIETVDQI